MDEITCEQDRHKFAYRDTAKTSDYSGLNTKFVRVDYYFCTNCLKVVEKRQEAMARDTPEWYRGGT